MGWLVSRLFLEQKITPSVPHPTPTMRQDVKIWGKHIDPRPWRYCPPKKGYHKPCSGALHGGHVDRSAGLRSTVFEAGELSVFGGV